ncbi:MAG: hypothetical protein EZS28_042975 [Streblomastix strix]|uniref:Uncharacterized protein n=1 Tax=Streblomastix strix TaxID=222440 RepID=A0A5J4TTF8_9EUKA|nr:MAG: hypothetical protein EZS28_042975 [Streblomastix strix]
MGVMSMISMEKSALTGTHNKMVVLSNGCCAPFIFLLRIVHIICASFESQTFASNCPHHKCITLVDWVRLSHRHLLRIVHIICASH